MNRLLRPCAALALAVFLTGCQGIPASSVSASSAVSSLPIEIGPAAVSSAPASAAPPAYDAPAGFAWAVLPSIEAADILPMRYSRPVADAGGYGAVGLVSAWPCAAIRIGEDAQGSTWGLIDYDGRLLIDCVYNQPFVGFDGRLSINQYDGTRQEWEYLPDGTLQPINSPEITGTNVNPHYLWRADEEKLYLGSGQDGFYLVGGNVPLGDLADPSYSGMAYYADHPISVEGPFEYGNQVVVLQNGRPAGGPIDCDDGGFINFSCGVAAVCQNGLWGLVNADGTQRLPFAYEGLVAGIYDNLQALPASEDTVVLYQNGRPGLYSLAKDEMLIPFGCTDGCLQELRPLVNGRCFAKAGGLWGVLELPS